MILTCPIYRRSVRFFRSDLPELLWSYLVNAVPSDLYGERIQVVDGGGTQVVPPIAAQVIVLVSNEYD